MDIERVIVPLDESALSQRALAIAATVARSSGATLLLYSQVDKHQPTGSRSDHLQQLAATVDDVEVEVHVGEDPTPAKGIEQVVRARERSLLCMSTHGRGGVGKSLLGSVAEDVLARLTDPILLIGQHCDPEASPVTGEVVVCVDGSTLSEAMIDWGAEWAATFGQPLRLLQVIAEDWADEVAAAGVDLGDVSEASYVMELASRLRHRSSLSPESEVAYADDPKHPADAITETLRARAAGLAALSTHGRSGLHRLIVGSVTMRVVHDAPCPALVYRPSALDEEAVRRTA